jgi:YegS/Rv2252/BmrU family lipid kinase
MTRALVITNPVAARSKPRTLETSLAVLRRGGWQLEVVETTGPTDPRWFAEQALVEGYDRIVVHGGDGTLIQAAAAMVGSEVPMGLLPAGTGNVLAGNLGIPRSARAAAEVVLRGRPRRIDLGRLDRLHGDAYFSVAAGTGADAAVMGETTTAMKRTWGVAAYVATAVRVLPSIRSSRHLVTVDGEVMELEASMVLVANCRMAIPPVVPLGPDIELDDGLLNVVAVRADGLADGLRAVWQVMRNPERKDERLIRYAAGRVVTVSTDAPALVELDGDVDGLTPFTAEVVPGAIAVMTPLR